MDGPIHEYIQAVAIFTNSFSLLSLKVAAAAAHRQHGLTFSPKVNPLSHVVLPQEPALMIMPRH